MAEKTEDALAQWVREEQAWLWSLLPDAIARAMNGRWSIESGNIARRIVEAARLVGPTPPEEVNWPLLAGGLYDAVLNAGGVVDGPAVDEAWLREWEPRMGKHGGTVAVCRGRYVASVSAVLEPREAGFIRAVERPEEQT